jgi:L-alanine-DL-glutamate epimerase-like enolase superfamily enzyme
MAEKYNIFAFEEPVTPNPKLHAFVSSRTSVPIAGGERLYSRWQFAPYLEAGTLQMIQPDLSNCGGLTEGKKICDMAYTYDVGVQAHVCASPIAAAAAMQLEAAIPNFNIHEHHVYNRFEMNKRLAIHDYQPKDGFISVPDLPGLGNELSGYALSSALKITV